MWKQKKACAELTKNIEIRFNKSNDGVDRPLPILKSRKGVRLMKDKLDGRFLWEVVVLRQIMHSYLRRRQRNKSEFMKGQD